MDTKGQLKLLLWKDFLIRRRHLGVATLVFGWAIIVFLILYIVRENVDPEYSQTCSFAARALPSTGLFPFVQSFLCNADNKCNNLSAYEEVPAYRNAKLTEVATQLQTTFTNDTILKVIKSLPDVIGLLKVVGLGLDSPELEGIFGHGIQIAKLFVNSEFVKKQIYEGNPKLDVDVLDDVFNSSIKLGHIFQEMGDIDIASSICEPKKLEKYLVLPENSDTEKIALNLCNIDASVVPNLIQTIFDNADFNGLLNTVGEVVNQFTNYDMFKDIRKITEVILDLNLVKDNAPKKLRLKSWLPDIISEMKNMNKTHLDPEYINNALKIIEPYFIEEKLYPKYKSLIINAMNILVNLQNKIISTGIVKNIEMNGPKNFSDLVTNIKVNIEKLFNPTEEDIKKQHENLLEIANDVIVALPAFYSNDSKPWINVANILDSLKSIIGNEIFNRVSIISNIFANGVMGLHNTIRGEYESEKIMYELCEKHSNTVSTLFSLGPEFITSMLNCFSNISCTSIIVEKRNNISEIFCDKKTTEEIIPEAASIKNIGILCNIDLNSFIDELNKDFKLNWIDEIIINSSKLEFGDSENSFLNIVKNTENFIQYLETRKNITEEISHINWEQIFPDIENTELKSIIHQARQNSGLYMLNVQLSYLNYHIKNTTKLNRVFNATSEIIEGLLKQYNLIPKPLLKSVINNLPDILENILKTFTNKTKILSLSSIDDWEKNFCLNPIKNTEFIICETIRFLNVQGKLPWYEQPIISAVYSVVKNFTENNDLNFTVFTENTHNLYYTVSDIVNTKYPKYNWDSEIFQNKFWMKWFKMFDAETGIHFSLQIITKIADFIEMNYLDKKTETKWGDIKTATNVANHLVSFYLDIIDFSLGIDNNTETNFPLTFELSKNISQNMKHFIEDLERVNNLNDLQIQELIEWLKNPCLKNINEKTLNLSSNSINVLLALQDFDCNYEKYVQEWNLSLNQENNTSLQTKILQQSVTKLSRLIQNLKITKMNNTIDEIDNIKFIHDGIQLEKLIFKVIDDYLHKKVMPQESMNRMWSNLMQCRNEKKYCREMELDTARYTTKFIAAGIHEVSNRVKDYINLINGTEGVDPLRLIGFFNTSAVYKLYQKLPDYTKIFIATYRSADFERKILDKRSRMMDFKCNDVMDNLIIPANNSVTLEDIAALKKYLCPSLFEWPILHDNIFLETVNKLQDMFLETPVVQLNISFVTMSQDLFDVKDIILNMFKYGKVNINQLWNKIWTKDMEDLFHETKKLNFNSNNTITRLFKYIEMPKDKLNISANLIDPKYGFGDFSFLLQEINSKLENFTSQSSSEGNEKQISNLIEIYTRDFVGLFSYMFVKYGDDFGLFFEDFCKSKEKLEETDVLVPRWIIEDDGNILERFCNLSNIDITNRLVPNTLSGIKKYNVVLEDLIIQFLSTLENFSKNKTEIDLANVIKNNFNLKDILEKRFPNEEELKNSSLQKSHQLSTHYKSSILELYQNLRISTSLLNILKGGDWWATLMSSIDDQTLKIWLRILENAPHIILHLSDAAISPHFLYDITSTVVTKGPFALCQPNFEIERYVNDDNIIAVIHEVCSKPLAGKNPLYEIFDEEGNETEVSLKLNENKFAQEIIDFEQTLIDLIKQGPKKFDLPKWMNETEIIKAYIDYAKHNSNPLRLLQTVTNVITEVIDVGSVFYKNEGQNCTWCTFGTIFVREFGQHLSKAQKYTEFLCNAPKMEFTEIKRTLIEDFKWGNFFQDMFKNVTYSVDDFDREIHDIVETIRVQIITFYTNKTLQSLPEKCFKDIADAPSLRNVSTYITAMKEITKTLKTSSIQFLNSSFFNIPPQNFTSLIEDHIPILQTPENIFNSDFSERLEKLYVDNVTVNEIMNAKIDANMLHKIKSGHELEMNIKDKYLFQKLFTFQNLSSIKKVYLDLNSENASVISEVIFASINKELDKKLIMWKNEAIKNFDWMTKIFENFEDVIANGGNILEFISNIDFSSISSGNINISGMLKGVLDLLEKNSIEKLFDSLRELVKSTSPFIRNEKLENDLYKLLDGVENLDIFKNLGLLRIKYKISDLVKNWPQANKYFVQKLHLEEDVVDDLLNSSIDLSAILSSQDDGLNIRQMMCDPEELIKLIYFKNEDPIKVAEKVSTKICSLNFNELQDIATTAFKNINLTQILGTIMNTTVNTILNSANMTEEEGRLIVKNVGIGAELLPELKVMFGNISENMKMLPSFDSFKSDNNSTTDLVLSPELLAVSSKLLCGRPIVQASNKLFKTISEAKDFNADQYDIIEQETLPSDFCRNLYRDVVSMEVGKIIWAYIKPLLRGQILYTPNIPAVKNILEQANSTFENLGELQDILNRMTNALTAIEDKDELDHILDNIQNFMKSSIVQLAIENVIKSITTAKIDLNQLNFKEMLNQFGDTTKITSALKYGSDFLNCVILNRFVGVDTEEELEERAKELMETNEFIAGVVFLNVDTRRKRSLDIPKDVTYKIRMDIDSVPSTSAMKYKFWTPGPEDDFLDELRYFRGFIQLQDLIDNAIIKVKTEGLREVPQWSTLTQEVPYPCWTKDFFKSALAISQAFQVCFFFGLLAIVAAAVRYIVWEKESGNTMVMNVMGLKYLTHCISWFIVTLVEICFIMICIFIIIEAGYILPLCDSFLLFLYLIEYGFSIIMFCFMISSMFNSASLAAVGSAIFYLISFMPFVIIIALETTLPTWAKMLTNLSMSTTFCYGCLYLIRYELQGVGLQWYNTWDTPIPGDQMSFGMSCIFLLFDGILYGVIGYLCSRKTQGENYLDDNVSNTNIINDEPLKIGVTIKSLTKIYNSRKKTVKAIEDIDITLYTGQVTTLLGHNGAGKTTLIKILTGMMQPTSGQIIINSEITENGARASRFLGVCPQGSVLINTMTAVEHLIFYAMLKTSKSRCEVMPEVMDIIDSLSLGHLSDEPVAYLSEGMRRRLCVAIAFIGKPKLVVLDEPSSGVDPVARRQIWDLVIKYKEGCTVLLTTHYLDEAELLSDRVVVLHKGNVLCSGSPLILRQSYGSGYKITVTYPTDKEKQEYNNNTEILLPVLKSIASNATVSAERQYEVDFTVPFNSPQGVPNNFEAVANILEENQANLGYTNFSMNCATLEQVFMDLCAKADAKLLDEDKTDTISQIGKSYSSVFTNSVIEDGPPMKDEEFLLNTGEKLTGGTIQKFCALIKKRAIHYAYDWRVIFCALFLPTLFVALAMGFSLIRPPNSNEPSLKLSPELYDTHSTSFISVDTNDMTSFINDVSRQIVTLHPPKPLDVYSKGYRECSCEDGMQKCLKPSGSPQDTLLKLSDVHETMDWLVDTHDEYIEKRYGGWSLSDKYVNDSAMIVWYNNKGYHSMPAYLNTMNSAILRTLSPGSSITTYSHPLKLSVDQLSKSSILQHVADVGIAMVLLVAFSLVPASGSMYLVQERVNEEKRLQLLCGVSPTLYWIVAFVWDIFVLLCSICLAVIVFKIFGLPVYNARDNLAAISLLIFLYGWACIPFIHLVQRFFKDSSMANMILFCICMFIGVAELTCLLLMDILGKTQFVADFRDVLHSIYLIFPQFVLGDGLIEISKNNIQAEILERFHMDTYLSPLGWDLMGLHYLSLTLVGIILFAVNLIIENEWFITNKKTATVYPSDTSGLEIVNLTKEYKTNSGKHIAVNNVSLKVPLGQCLGLIGVNGAGKSTTFKTLTSELRPTSGRIFLQGREISKKPFCTGEMGYCPQCDSLDPKLTVRETLKLYLTLRGIDNKNEILNKMMAKFELTNYANRKTENLSGGNKRKLCTALSVLGRTSLILMDEPTSGMDPHARSLVGLTIKQLIQRNRSVILTSHSVEDCEALCSNIAVMINGKIIVEGTPQYLKEKYGSGYIISIKLSKASEQELLLELMHKHFPGCELMSRQYLSSQFAVPIINTKLSEMFNKMTKISEYVSVEDYNLVQSSLDQVFINLATKSENQNGFNDQTTIPNMYSMDVIQ